MRILLIEDDLNFCETLRFQLEQEAYEVEMYATMEEMVLTSSYRTLTTLSCSTACSRP